MKTFENKLRNALKANAAFSLFSGLSLISCSTAIAQFMHISNNNVLIYIGVALLLFVGSLLFNAFKKDISPAQVKVIIYQDWAWVIGSAILLILNPFNISLAGNLLIAGVALVVMAMAIVQAKALKKL